MVEADSRAAARRLRFAAFASALVGALRFGLATQSDLLGMRLALTLDPIFELGGFAAAVFLAIVVFRFARRAPPDSARRVLHLSSALIATAVGVEAAMWLLAHFDLAVGRMAEPALLSVLFWAAGRGALWLGLFRWLSYTRAPGAAPPAPLAALVPLFAGLRVVLFLGTMLAPYLEAGGEARRLFLSTASLRNWLAFALAIVCDGAIAWLAGRAARVS